MEIAFITPPVGINVYGINAIIGDRIPLVDIFKGVGWFVVMDLIALGFIIAFPQISLWLPNMMLGN